MKYYLRISAGLFCVFFGTYAIFREDGGLIGALFLELIGFFVLRKEILAAFLLLKEGFRFVGGKLWGHIREVEEMRYCKCCGKLAMYMVITCIPKPSAAEVPPRKHIFVCRSHHPNPDIGESAAELRAYIKDHIHPQATDECVFPHNPY